MVLFVLPKVTLLMELKEEISLFGELKDKVQVIMDIQEFF